MNNKNKILVGCLALLLVLSVGYALFSDTITINGTATAKGNFGIDVSCESNISNLVPVGTKSPDIIDGGGYFTYNDNNYKNESCSANDNEVSFNVELTQPAAQKSFLVKATNTGTIDAMLELNNTGISVEYERCLFNPETEELVGCTDFTGEYEGLDKIIKYDIAGYSLSDNVDNIFIYGNTYEEFLNNFTDNGNIVLKPGTSIYIRFTAHWDDSDMDQGLNIGKSDSGSEYQIETMNAVFNFVQKN